MSPRPRFSKASVAAEIARSVAALRANHPTLRLDPDNGWAQVAGKDEEAHRVYGEFRALLDLAERIGVEVPR